MRQEFGGDGVLSYLRLHGRNAEKWWRHDEAWERNDYFYPANNIRRRADRLRQLAADAPQKRFYLFFNNHAGARAVANGLMLQTALQLTGQVRAQKSLIEAFS